MKLKHLITAIAATVACASAHAGNSINLGNYQLTGSHKLDTLDGMGLEASAVTYAADRGSLFFVGDEGKGVVEVSQIANIAAHLEDPPINPISGC